MDRTIEAAGTLPASSDTLAPREGDPATGPVVLPPTTRVGRYALGEPLGAGGMGVVYQARDPELDRSVAIKVLLSDRGEDRVNDRFLREAQAMAKLSHPNVVPIYDVGAWGSGLFLAMELVDGETLRKWMQGQHSWREVVAMFVQAGRGLAEAHAAGMSRWLGGTRANRCSNSEYLASSSETPSSWRACTVVSSRNGGSCLWSPTSRSRRARTTGTRTSPTVALAASSTMTRSYDSPTRVSSGLVERAVVVPHTWTRPW